MTSSFKNISKWITIIFTLLIWTIKLVIRPNYNDNDIALFILGVAPNLLGSFALLFGAYWLFEKYLLMILSVFDIRIILTFFFSLLVINEYLQLISFFGRTFDWYDILFSAIGLITSYFLFTVYYKKTVQFNK